jgi:hypothetical protein
MAGGGSDSSGDLVVVAAVGLLFFVGAALLISSLFTGALARSGATSYGRSRSPRSGQVNKKPTALTSGPRLPNLGPLTRPSSKFSPLRQLSLIILAALLVACSEQDREKARLAAGCINASPDNRVKLSGSWSNNFDVLVEGEKITVRTEVPVGIGLSGTPKFRHREFECRKTGDRIKFISATWE